MGSRKLLKIGLSLAVALAMVAPVAAFNLPNEPVLVPYKSGKGKAGMDEIAKRYGLSEHLRELKSGEERTRILGVVKIGEENPPQSPECMIVDFELENPEGYETVVHTGDKIPYAEWYQPYVMISNPSDEPAVIQPELDIYKVTPVEQEVLYSTSFEDPGKIYEEWMQMDLDSTYPGGYDSWSWSSARATDGSHSMKCTQYDEYLNSQEDFLVKTDTIDVSEYYAVNVSWDIWVKGEYKTWYVEWWGGEIYSPLDYAFFLIACGDPHNPANWYPADLYAIIMPRGPFFVDSAGNLLPEGSYIFPDTELSLYDVDTPGGYAKDYRSIARKIPGKPGWWHCWANLKVEKLPDPEHFSIVFGWHSDIERTFEGAYIDNVKIVGIKEIKERVYQSHSQEWLVWEPQKTYAFKFPMKWYSDYGYWEAVLKIKNSDGGYDDMKVIRFQVRDYIDCEIAEVKVTDSFTGKEVPNGGVLTEGSDAHISFVYHQAGNVPAENVPVTATAYKLEKQTLYFDDFEGAVGWTSITSPGAGPVHISTDFAWSGTHSLAFNDPDTKHYRSNALYIAYADVAIDVRNLEEAYVDLYYIAVLADEGDWFFPAFVDWDGTHYIIGLLMPQLFLTGPLCETEWIGPMQPQCRYWHIDLLEAYDVLYKYGYFRDANGRQTYRIGIGFWLGGEYGLTDSSGVLYERCAQWSGVYIDDVKITGKVVGDLVWQDTVVIDHADPKQVIEGQFEWENVPFSEYKIIVTAACAGDVHPEDNSKATSFKVMEYLERMTEKETYQVDLSTCTPKAWCISPIHGYSEDDSYALATNCETPDVPACVNDYVALAPGKGSEAACCPMCIDISHIEWPEKPFFYDDFSTFPGVWTVPSCAPTQSYSNYAGGTPPEVDFYWYDMYWNCPAGPWYMESPVINVGGQAVKLHFKSYIDDYFGAYYTYNCTVWVNIDGTGYVDMTPWTNPITGDVGPDTYTIDLGVVNTVQVKFEFTGNPYGINDWYIDDVQVGEFVGGTPLVLEMNYTCDLYPAYARVVLEVAPCMIPSEEGKGVYTISLYDLAGDGWKVWFGYWGTPYYAWLDIYVNGELVLDTVTLKDGFGPENYKIAVNDGDVIFIDFSCPTCMGYAVGLEDIYYRVYDTMGNLVAEIWPYYDPMGGDVTITAHVPKETVEEKPPKCFCPPGVSRWIPVATFTGNYPDELKHFSVDLRNYLPEGTTHMCLRFRLDTLAACGRSYAGPGVGFHIHDIRITNLFNVTKKTDPEPVFEDFYDDFEDGYLYDDWCVDCVHYGCNWTYIGDYTWSNSWEAEPVHSALIWMTELHANYEAYLDGEEKYRIEDGTTLYIELSDDGGNTWYIINRVDGPATTYGNWVPIGCTVDYNDFDNLSGRLAYAGTNNFRFDLSPWAGKDILIRFRVFSHGPYFSGVWQIRNVRIIGKEDYKAPVSTATLSGDVKAVVNNVPKYAGPVTVTITASDDVAMGEIHYILDGGAEQVVPGASATFTVSEDGTHTVEYWAVDAVGNEETPHHTLTFAIDLTPPTVEITAPGTGLYIFGKKIIDLKTTLIIGGFTAEAKATDDEGVKLVKFYIDDNFVGAAEEPTNGDIYSYYICVKHMGKGTLKVVAEDVVGNTASASMDITYIKLF